MKCTSRSSIHGAKQAISIIASPENSDPTAAIPSPGEPTSDTARVNMMTTTSLENTIASGELDPLAHPPGGGVRGGAGERDRREHRRHDDHRLADDEHRPHEKRRHHIPEPEDQHQRRRREAGQRRGGGDLRPEVRDAPQPGGVHDAVAQRVRGGQQRLDHPDRGGRAEDPGADADDRAGQARRVRGAAPP